MESIIVIYIDLYALCASLSGQGYLTECSGIPYNTPKRKCGVERTNLLVITCTFCYLNIKQFV